MSPAARRVRLVLQARMSSSRLPGKVMMPVAGRPLFALAAQRARGEHADIVIATSSEASDDALHDAARSAGFAVVRGPLEDVMARFVFATADLGDQDLCVRLTADNCFPDQGFIAAVLAIRETLEVEYVGYGAAGSGLPYGLSAEAFTVCALRQAQRDATTAYEREHVTPLIARRHALNVLPPLPGSDQAFGSLRCTIDTAEDYALVTEVFRETPDPLTASWLALTHVLAAKAVHISRW